MRDNRIQRKDHTRKVVLATLAIIALVAAVTGVSLAYSTLRDLWLEQCVVTDVDTQVTVSGSNMIKPDVILSELGIRNGSNLALIDFNRKRSELLAKIPNLRSLSFVRHLPNRLASSFEERKPIVRMGFRGDKHGPGRVADGDGMGFYCSRGTEMLPTIRDDRRPGTKAGEFLTGRARAALTFLDVSRDPAYSELGVLEVDISKPDYLFATLGDYSRVKLFWTGMDDAPSAANRQRLERQLDLLIKTMRTQIGAGAVIWNATQENGIITADRKEILL